MSIAVTGASGHLGRLVVESLVAHGADPSQVVATARTTAKVADLQKATWELDPGKKPTKGMTTDHGVFISDTDNWRVSEPVHASHGNPTMTPGFAHQTVRALVPFSLKIRYTSYNNATRITFPTDCWREDHTATSR